MNEPYSVLMSVYYNDKVDELEQSIQSMLKQSYPADEFVIVVDGIIPPELDKLLLKAYSQNPNVVKLIRLDRNMGLGVALKIGLLKCKNDWIFRMDSDDISHYDRCEKQLYYAIRHQLDLCSAWVTEFDPFSDVQTIKKVPEAQQEIYQMARRRSPINHPCVLFKKNAVIAAGNYRDIPKFEDYDLWIRMILNGAKMRNMQESLLDMRGGKNLYFRRGGRTYCKHIKVFCKTAYAEGFFTKNEMYGNMFLRCGVSLMPNCIRHFLYQNFLRKKHRSNHETI